MTQCPRSNRHYTKKKHRPLVEDEVIAEQLSILLTRAITNQDKYYRKLRLRKRILNLLDLLQNCLCGMIRSFRFYVFLVFFGLANSNITL
jgi:hypothetical protein